MQITRFPLATITAALATAFLCSCIEDPNTTTSLVSGANGAAVAKPDSAPVVEEKLSKHDVALRFLTAFIRLDRNMALQYATPKAVSRLDWNRPHGGNIPYYDDKMILYYSGGLAKVYFQDKGNGSFQISDLHVY